MAPQRWLLHSLMFIAINSRWVNVAVMPALEFLLIWASKIVSQLSFWHETSSCGIDVLWSVAISKCQSTSKYISLRFQTDPHNLQIGCQNHAKSELLLCVQNLLHSSSFPLYAMLPRFFASGVHARVHVLRCQDSSYRLTCFCLLWVPVVFRSQEGNLNWKSKSWFLCLDRHRFVLWWAGKYHWLPCSKIWECLHYLQIDHLTWKSSNCANWQNGLNTNTTSRNKIWKIPSVYTTTFRTHATIPWLFHTD